MGLISRVFSGAVRAVTAPIRAALTPITFTFNMAKTVLGSVGELAKGNIGGAISNLATGTVSNVARAGVNLAQGGMPWIAFAEGFARDKGMFQSGGALGLT